MSAPREVVRSPLAWGEATHPDYVAVTATAAAWLLGYVRTDVPGYREIEVGGNLYTVAASGTGGHRFDDLITAVNTALGALDPITWATNGKVVPTPNSERYPDRLGWVLGLVDDAGHTTTGDDDASVVPPAGIPLLGATWLRVDSEADRREIIDRHRRNQGYVWGAALIWRCKMTMHRWALEALQTGWCLRGKVTLAGATMLNTPVSVSEPAGAITGYALGLDSVRWLDSIQQYAEVEMSIVSE